MEGAGLAQHTASMPPITPHPPRTSLFLVEDSPAIRQRLEVLLRDIPGVEIVGYAEEADAALAGIARLKPDAVVLDLVLAKGHGIDVLRALKQADSAVEVFVLTNVATPQYRRACMALAAKGFFDKTTEFMAVREAIASSSLEKQFRPDKGTTSCKRQ
jgi:two-component system response regulator DevR